MNEMEKEAVSLLDAEYVALIDQMVNIAAVHVASLFSEYDRGNVKKNLDRLATIQQFSALGLGVEYRKLAAVSDMPGEKIISLTKKGNVLRVNKKWLAEKSSLEDAMRLMQAVHTATFLDHVQLMVKSQNEELRAYAQKYGWSEEMKNPVDAEENPQAYFEQKHIKAALAYGIVYTNQAVRYAAQALRRLQSR